MSEIGNGAAGVAGRAETKRPRRAATASAANATGEANATSAANARRLRQPTTVSAANSERLRQTVRAATVARAASTQGTAREREANGRALGLGTGSTVFSYLIGGMAAYGGIGWLIGKAVHVSLLFPIGMVVGLGISVGYVIYRFGRPAQAASISTRAPAPEHVQGQTRGQMQPQRATERNNR
jgi:F0F1-type ATP synthase assembly protein I